ncbi:hypothetical protein [Pseudanabaena sp. FACHB-2040]|uniref:hypothetical protein n=1 Tax=Pseudanabaena sp. FACHB-2040 TaxID=2692859 RepID=UPI0016837A41|nr:hypothetical protein [Pseudanabaena sp. FACHB-2040]MBD2257476.1 hypothetical protein [Pseudanabaena sp. FACHB-2040]
MTALPLAASVFSPLQTAFQQNRQRSLAVAIGTSLLTGLLALVTQAPLQASSPLADGQYLYGEAQTADVAGSTYILLQVQQDRVVGAFYQPSSSFDCFHGTVTGQELDLSVVDSYERTSHPFQLALAVDPVPVAGASGVLLPVQIEGFNRLNDLSGSDQEILSTCLADHPL